MIDPLPTICSRLDEIERSDQVAILLAVESGSRAWGFPSVDSDYDVRFIFCKPKEHYLSIDLEDFPDVIERPIEDAIDLSGWDIRKALKLFRKSNPPLLEWLQCPIIYRKRSQFAERLKELLPSCYSPRASYFHYLHMAQGNLREYLRGDQVWQKKYFYVLRPLLAIRWIKAELGPVPIEFERLCDATISDASLRREIDGLLRRKMGGAELDYGPRIEAISQFIETEIGNLRQETFEGGHSAPSDDVLNELFRKTILEVWQ